MRTRVIQVGEADRRACRFCLMFPREALSVPVTRRVLGDTLGRLGVDEDCIGDLLLAVTEACTNVLQHGGTSHRYEVVANIDRSRCLVEVLDSGRGFDPAGWPFACCRASFPPGTRAPAAGRPLSPRGPGSLSPCSPRPRRCSAVRSRFLPGQAQPG